MKTALWLVLLVDQIALLLIYSVKLRQFELTDFMFRMQVAHHSGEEAKLAKALHKQLPQVKLLQAAELTVLAVIGVTLWTHLNRPLLGILYALTSLLAVVLLSKFRAVRGVAKKLFMQSLGFLLPLAQFLSPLWWLIGLPPKKETLLPASYEEFLDLLRRLPSTVLQPNQRQRLESVLGSDGKVVKDIMTVKKRVVMVEPSATLGPVVLSDLQKSGHGYFPVATKKGEPEGVLALSEVADVQLAKQRSSVREVMSLHTTWVNEDASLYDLAVAFLQEKQYIIFVRNLEGEFVGVVTVADLMKHLLGIVKD